MKKFNRSCWIKSNSYSSVSYIIIDQLVSRLLSIAWKVLEFNSIVETIREELSELKMVDFIYFHFSFSILFSYFGLRVKD